MIRKIFRWFLGVIAAIILLAAAMVGAIDRTPVKDKEFYNEMMMKLDTLQLSTHGSSALTSGWARVNITPSKSMPMAGYVPRDHFDTVHDSLYANILVIANSSFRTAMINVDLLIFPPLLRDKIREQMNDDTFLYLSATHTHSSVGGWDPSIGGRIITGKFSEEYVDDVATMIVSAIKNIKPQPSTIQYFEGDATDLIENRLDPDSFKIDGKLRGIKLVREDNTDALLFTLSAHSTSISSDSLDLSADYPGKTIKLLEKKNTFAMFMSGMVGSSRFKWSPLLNQEFISDITPGLVGRIDTAHYDSAMTAPFVKTARVPIEFGEAQPRIDKNWKINNWAFRMLFGKLKGEFTYLELGDIVFIGTPCDFSSELYAMDSLGEYASKYNKHLIITSFNGDYDGYITYDKHYELSRKEEINALNWVGPYYGDYFSTMIKKLVSK